MSSPLREEPTTTLVTTLLWPATFSWTEEADKMIPLLEVDIKRISMKLEAVEKLFVQMTDVTLCAVQKLSMLLPDKTKQLSKQLDAAKQNMMELVDVVKQT